MPWNSAVRPSIQVGILRSVAEAEGWEVEAHYAYLDFYGLARSTLGLSDETWADAYETVSEKLYHLAAGDWVFARRHADAAQRDAYFTVLREHRVDENTIELIDSLRDVAETHVERTADLLLADAPSVIGFTSMFSQNGPTLAVAERLRERGFGGVIVMGGSNCEGVMGRTLLARHPVVDAVVDGPGEDAFVGLLRHVAAGRRVPSGGRLLTRWGVAPEPVGGPVVGRSLSVPVPNYDGFFEQLEGAGLSDLVGEVTLPVEFSRGCWWGAKTHCTFCGLNGATMSYRSKHPDSVADELRHLMDRYGVLDFFAVDNILDLRYLDSALPLIEKLDTDHSLFFEVKANMEWADIRAMRRAGIRSVQPGIESLSTEGLRHLKKGATAYQNIRFLLGCAECGVLPVWNILTGYPNETPESLREQIALLPSLTHLQPPDNDILVVHFDRFSPYVERPEEFGLRLSRPLPGYRHVYPYLAPDDLWNIAYHFEGEFADDPDNAELRRTLAARVSLWRARDPRTTFTYRLGFDSIALTDRRPGLPAGRTVLAGAEARLYRALIGGARHRDLSGAGGPGEDWAWAAHTLAEWERRRWIHSEGTKVIALATRRVPSAYRTPPAKGTPRRARNAVPVPLGPPRRADDAEPAPQAGTARTESGRNRSHDDETPFPGTASAR
ncbi:RiPP maturation radical SAM C-methyltransferase [Streptomyces sp. NPDC026672]|uniref:RiPP maturation radical SAM C-methyltransferase n=1 Tax=unclassified Streptomyces TaxID=2593676 RepID=UPI0033F447C9